MSVFIIAEAACTWLHGGLEAAYRSIRAAKECEADAWKTQWTSDPGEMGMRRWKAMGCDTRFEGPHDLAKKYSRLAWPAEWLPLLKAECDRVGVEFMVTVFVPKDIATIAPLVKRFKVSAFESQDREFIKAHGEANIIVSLNRGKSIGYSIHGHGEVLYCVSEYPTQLDKLGMREFCEFGVSHAGLSDHTTSVLTGAVAVGAGARIIEKHVKLSDTPTDDPDYGHSLPVDRWSNIVPPEFMVYVANVREAERML